MIHPIDYEKIFLFSSDPIMLADRDGVYIAANQAAADVMHLSLAEMIGTRPADLCKRGIASKATTVMVLQTKKSVTEVVRVHEKDYLSTSIPLLDEDGEVVMVLTNSRSDTVLNEFSRQLTYEQKQHTRYKEINEYLLSTKGNDLICESSQMKAIVAYCSLIAKTDSTVMLTGESGTGKDMLARFIHNISDRKDKAFIPVNCSAIPLDLFESEFFGYQAGAFTGASAKGKIGFLQMAHGGTLFLDELGELPLMMQSKLLRVVESGEFYPVGSNKPVQVDLRIITATNRDLMQMVKEKKFREDLYYRLYIVPIHIPPLRERADDVEALIAFFLRQFNRKYNKSCVLSPEELDALKKNNWPGNIRELRNAVERFVLICSSEYSNINLDMMFTGKQYQSKASEQQGVGTGFAITVDLDISLQEAVERFEEGYIQAVLYKYHGRPTETAASLKIHRSTLYRKQKPGTL